MNQKRTSQLGFTLIELVIAIAIVGILMAIAIPAYNDQVRKTKRATAKSELLEVVQAKERFHTLNGTYIGSPCGDNTDDYTYTCPVETATTFSALATAIGDQVNDTRCVNLGINHQGVRTISGSGTVEDCW